MHTCIHTHTHTHLLSATQTHIHMCIHSSTPQEVTYGLLYFQGWRSEAQTMLEVVPLVDTKKSALSR